MLRKNKKRPFLLGTVAGSLALSSPLILHVPVDAQTKEQISEMKQLKYGDHEQAVVELQRKLKTLRYYQGEITANYNVLTEHAVRSFQSEHALQASGSMNEETIVALLDEMDKHHHEVVRKHAEKLHYGEQSDRVKNTQQSLSYLGYYTSEIDGIAGNLTKEAIENYGEIEGFDLALETLEPPEQVIHVVHTTDSPTTNQSSQATETSAQQKKQTVKVQKSTANHASVMSTAQSYLGSPYVWGGDTPTGFDCSGFLQYVYQQHGISLPRTVSAIWNSTVPVDQPSVGDLVFFETYQSGPSHAGIYLGNGQFIHAGTSTGVTISHMDNGYWQPRYLGARTIKR